MKNCSYCGRENEDQAVHCKECGTGFELPDTGSVRLKLKRPFLSYPGSRLRNGVSLLVYFLALCLIPLGLYLTFLCVCIVDSRNAIGFFYFLMLLAPATFLGSLVLVIVPSAILYKRSRSRRDRRAFWIGFASLLVSASEAVVMYALLHDKRLYGPGG